MAIALVGSVTTNNGITSTASTAYVSGIANGNALLTYISGNSGLTITPPSGWTQVFNVNQSGIVQFACYKKISDGTETGNADFTLGGTFEWAACMIAFSGVDTTTPVGASNTQSNTGPSTIVDCSTGITPSAANSMFLIVGAMDSSATGSSYQMTTSNPSWTEFVDIALSGRSLNGAYASRAAATATGACQYTGSLFRRSIGSVLSLTEGATLSVKHLTLLGAG